MSSQQSKYVSLTNMVLSAVAAIMLMTVCFSYSNSVNTARRIPFMVVQETVVDVAICVDLGLKTFCAAECGTEQCLSQSGTSEGTAFGDYATIIDSRCPLPVADGESEAQIQSEKDACTTLHQCNTGGKVTFAFALISMLLAMAASLACYHRFRAAQNDDPQAAHSSKRSAIWLSVSCVVTSIISYSAMQWCAWGMDHVIEEAYSNVPAQIRPELVLSVSPGSGGVLVILSFVFFSIMVITNIMLPSGSSGGDLASRDGLKDPILA